MRFIKAFFLELTGILLLASALHAAVYQVSPSDLGLRQYLPGDIVHLLIEAPYDTVQINAIMPDGQEIKLSYDDRSRLWHGYWEVPPAFKRGLYRAKLLARDVEGVEFEGTSAAFYITEPTLALMMKVSPQKPGAPLVLSSSEQYVIVPQAAVPAQPPVQPLTQTLTQPPAQTPAPPLSEEATVPQAAWSKAVKPEVTPPVKQAAKKPAKLKKKLVSVITKGDARSAKINGVIAARAHMSMGEYENARIQLAALLKTDPDNQAVKTMLNRVAAVIRAKGTEK